MKMILFVMDNQQNIETEVFKMQGILYSKVSKSLDNN